jgi:hypothetical protein
MDVVIFKVRLNESVAISEQRKRSVFRLPDCEILAVVLLAV